MSKAVTLANKQEMTGFRMRRKYVFYTNFAV